MLAGQMVVGGIQQDALVAARIIDDAGAGFPTIRAIDDHCARRIRSVVKSDGVGHMRAIMHSPAPRAKSALVGQ